MLDIRTEEGEVQLLPATEFVDFTLTTPITNLLNAFVRPNNCGPGTGITPTTGTQFDEDSELHTGLVELLDANTVRVRTQPGGTIRQKRCRFTVFEYMGAPGGPNEFVIHQSGVSALSGTSFDVLGTFVPNNPVHVWVVQRGGIWTGANGGTAPLPRHFNIISHVFLFTVLILIRMERSVADVNSIYNAHWTCVEFTGSNWTSRAAFVDPAAGILDVTIGEINNWENAFFSVTRRAIGLNTRDQGIVAWPHPTDTTKIRLRWEPSSSMVATQDRAHVQVFSNPELKVEHDDSVEGGGTPHPSTFFNQSTFVPITLFPPPEARAVISNVSNDFGAPLQPLGIWSTLFADGAKSIYWYTSDGRLIDNWSHQVLDFRLMNAEARRIVDADLTARTFEADLPARVTDVQLDDLLHSVKLGNLTHEIQMPSTRLAVSLEGATFTAELPYPLTQLILGVPMPEKFDQGPIAVNITKSRGDSEPFSFILKEPSAADPLVFVPVDITGMTFLLTVDTLEDPPDALTQVFQLVGSIVGLGTAGTVLFSPSVVDMDQTPATYFFDVQWTDGANLRTVIKGDWVIPQDITK